MKLLEQVIILRMVQSLVRGVNNIDYSDLEDNSAICSYDENNGSNENETDIRENPAGNQSDALPEFAESVAFDLEQPGTSTCNLAETGRRTVSDLRNVIGVGTSKVSKSKPKKEKLVWEKKNLTFEVNEVVYW